MSFALGVRLLATRPNWAGQRRWEAKFKAALESLELNRLETVGPPAGLPHHLHPTTASNTATKCVTSLPFRASTPRLPTKLNPYQNTSEQVGESVEVSREASNELVPGAD